MALGHANNTKPPPQTKPPMERVEFSPAAFKSLHSSPKHVVKSLPNNIVNIVNQPPGKQAS